MVTVTCWTPEANVIASSSERAGTIESDHTVDPVRCPPLRLCRTVDFFRGRRLFLRVHQVAKLLEALRHHTVARQCRHTI